MILKINIDCFLITDVNYFGTDNRVLITQEAGITRRLNT